MLKKNYKGRCEKIAVQKSKDVCRVYSEIQKSYLMELQADSNIKEIKCNVPMEGLEIGEFTSDFMCTTMSNKVFVCECAQRDTVTKPMTTKRLDASREYWIRHGIEDWRIVINERK